MVSNNSWKYPFNYKMAYSYGSRETATRRSPSTLLPQQRRDSIQGHSFAVFAWNDSQAFRAGNIGLDTDFSKQKLHGFRLAVKCGFQENGSRSSSPWPRVSKKYGRISGILRRQNIFCRRHNRLYGSADVIFLTVQLQLLLVVSLCPPFPPRRCQTYPPTGCSFDSRNPVSAPARTESACRPL